MLAAEAEVQASRVRAFVTQLGSASTKTAMVAQQAVSGGADGNLAGRSNKVDSCEGGGGAGIACAGFRPRLRSGLRRESERRLTALRHRCVLLEKSLSERHAASAKTAFDAVTAKRDDTRCIAEFWSTSAPSLDPLPGSAAWRAALLSRPLPSLAPMPQLPAQAPRQLAPPGRLHKSCDDEVEVSCQPVTKILDQDLARLREDLQAVRQRCVQASRRTSPIVRPGSAERNRLEQWC
eukprot:TRINITY_DN61905_c0_g1_i1.p1 TRINITY_DN61905_c0_g1~~TRINITY_DN61905_c0_g1_i1.p1  ORF type:complete len:262 (-),score=28.94 TRINITY_DN61905_c0_g1_i1:264-971(-)